MADPGLDVGAPLFLRSPPCQYDSREKGPDGSFDWLLREIHSIRHRLDRMPKLDQPLLSASKREILKHLR